MGLQLCLDVTDIFGDSLAEEVQLQSLGHFTPLPEAQSTQIGQFKLQLFNDEGIMLDSALKGRRRLPMRLLQSQKFGLEPIAKRCFDGRLKDQNDPAGTGLPWGLIIPR